MSTKNSIPATLELRENTNIATVYNSLVDGKPHQLKAIVTKLEKAGVARKLSLVFRLGRLLRRKTSMTIVIDYKAGTIQMVKSASVKQPKAVKAAKPVAKTSKTKPVSRKQGTKSHAKAVKAVKVAVGASDDDAMEE